MEKVTFSAGATDGSLLGGAKLVEGLLLYGGLALGVAHLCGRRWSALSVPEDLRLDARVLASWFEVGGRVVSGGYAVRLGTPWRDPASLATQLRDLWAWEPVVEHRAVRLVRSGDRLGLVRLIVGLVGDAAQARLRAVRASAPCGASEAVRRRAPGRLTDADVAEIRRRAALGHQYTTISLDFGVSEQHVARIARGEQRRDAGGVVVRRKARVKRLSRSEVRDILARVRSGESQSAVARAFGVGQPRVSRLVNRVRAV